MTCEEFQDRLLTAGPHEVESLAGEHPCGEAECVELLAVAREVADGLSAWHGRARDAAPPEDFASRTVSAMRSARRRPAGAAVCASRKTGAGQWVSAAAAVLSIVWAVLWLTVGGDAVRAATVAARSNADRTEAAAASVEKAEAWLTSLAEGNVVAAVGETPTLPRISPSAWLPEWAGGRRPAS